MYRSLITTAASASLLLAAGSSVAKEFVPKVGITIEQHSDARRSALTAADYLDPGEQKDTLYRPYIGFLFEERTSTINSEIDFSVERESYADDTFEAQNFFSIDGFIDYEVIPGRMSWAFEDAANKRRIDVTSGDTLDNYQNFNVFATGPDLLFTRGANEIVVKARLSDVFYSDELTDNLRYTLSGAMQREVSEVAKLGFEASAALVRFKNKGFPDDYDIVTLLTKYERDTPWGSAEIRGGYNAFLFDNGTDKSEPLFEAHVQVGDNNSIHFLSATASYKFTDPATEVFDPLYSRLFEVDGLGEIDSQERGGTGATEATKAEGSYEWRASRTRFRLFGFVQNLDRPDENQVSVEEFGTGMSLNYELTQNVSLWASYYAFESDFTNSPAGLVPVFNPQGEQIGTEPGTPLEFVNGNSNSIGISWHISEGLLLSLGASTTEEESNDPAKDFTDDSVSLRVDYRGIGTNR